MKIKISIIDENGIEQDYITRDIPIWNQYNVIKGLLINLYLLLARNFENSEHYKYLLKLYNDTITDKIELP